MTIFTAEQLLNPEKKEKPDDTFDVEIQFSEKKALNSVSMYCFLFSTYPTTLLTLLLSKLIVCWLRVRKFFFPPEQTILSSPCNLIEQLQYFLNQPERESIVKIIC